MRAGADDSADSAALSDAGFDSDQSAFMEPAGDFAPAAGESRSSQGGAGGGSWSQRIKNLLGYGPRCANGGARTVKGACACPPHFSGARCEAIECAHNGTAVPSASACRCADGVHFSGRFCEHLHCENSGRPLADGTCRCPPNWYSGRYCEQYTAPWAVLFGAAVGAFVLFVVVFIACRLRANQTRASSFSSRASRDGSQHGDPSSSWAARRLPHCTTRSDCTAGGGRRWQHVVHEQGYQLHPPPASEQIVAVSLGGRPAVLFRSELIAAAAAAGHHRRRSPPHYAAHASPRGAEEEAVPLPLSDAHDVPAVKPATPPPAYREVEQWPDRFPAVPPPPPHMDDMADGGGSSTAESAQSPGA